MTPCWRRRHRCHDCIVVATIATVAIAAATATAAAISAATSTISAAIATAFWLIVVCPCAAYAMASATVACPRRYRRWLLTPLSLLPQPQTAVPCSSCRKCVMFNILHLKKFFEHLCCHFLVDCCLPSRCLRYSHCCLPPPLPTWLSMPLPLSPQPQAAAPPSAANAWCSKYYI